MKGKTNTEIVISKTENLAAGTEVEIVDVCLRKKLKRIGLL